MKLGIEVLLKSPKVLNILKKKRVGLVCHPASVDLNLQHSLEILSKELKLSCAFGPQHGVNGEKQDNMIESEDFIHPTYKIPIFSLYGKVRRPTVKMMEHFDVLLFDLQDLGCRIYTFETTLLYLLEECARFKKQLIVLDRPNPIGRDIEGFRLQAGYESFVGAATFPMRHGLTVAELALYFKDFYKLDVELSIIKMQGYKPSAKPFYGWPVDRAWVNPSPNSATLNMARAYPGTVMIEGCTLSEGRGTTRALELVGAPDLDFEKVFQAMKKMAPQWLKGAIFRPCYFEPTFHKHVGQMCHGIMIHTDLPQYKPNQFKPYRFIALMLKQIRMLYPDYLIYRDFHYEYVTDKLAFDVINGGPELRNWIEDKNAKAQDLEKQLQVDEKSWAKERKKYLLYK